MNTTNNMKPITMPMAVRSMNMMNNGRIYTIYTCGLDIKAARNVVKNTKVAMLKAIYPLLICIERQLYILRDELERKGKFRMKVKQNMNLAFADIHECMKEFSLGKDGDIFANEYGTSIMEKLEQKWRKLHDILGAKMANYGQKENIGIITDALLAYNVTCTTDKVYSTIIDFIKESSKGIDLHEVFSRYNPQSVSKRLSAILGSFGMKEDSELVMRLTSNKDIGNLYCEVLGLFLDDGIMQYGANSANETIKELGMDIR